MGRPRKLPRGMSRRGKTYFARFRKEGRLIRQRLSTDYAAACEMLNDLRARADRADFDLVDNNYPWDKLKEEFLRWKRQTTRRPEEYARDLKHIEEYSRVQSIRQIDDAFVDDYREWRRGRATTRKEGGVARTASVRTINKEVGTLRHMLNMGVARRLIGSNPIAGVKPLRDDSPRKSRRSLSAEEVEAIFQHSPPYLRPVWRTFMTTGLRKRELINLRFADVDFDQQTLTVRAATAKNHKAREIPLDDETLATLATLRDEAKRRQPVRGRDAAQTEQQKAAFTREHVFVTKANTPLKNNLLTRFYSVCRKAGIEGAESGGSVDIHSLRVSFTTLSLENGATPRAVQAILGHATLGLTMTVYAKATDRTKRAAVAALPFVRKVSAPAHAVEFPVPTVHGARASAAASEEVVAEIRVAQ